MAAYVIADNLVTDPETYDAYRKEVPATLEPFGGRFLVRSGAHRTVEGDWQPNRLVVLEFPDAAARDRWYASAAYQRIIGLRQKASESNVVFVDGPGALNRAPPVRRLDATGHETGGRAWTAASQAPTPTSRPRT